MDFLQGSDDAEYVVEKFAIVHEAFRFPIGKSKKDGKFMLLGLDEDFTYQYVVVTGVEHDTLDDAMREARALYREKRDLHEGFKA